MDIESSVEVEKEIRVETLQVPYQAVTVRPGDVIVISLTTCIPLETTERLKELLKPIFPENKVLVLQQGATLGVARKEDIDGQSQG